MPLRLDTHSGEPIWRQIVEQVKYGVASGEFAPDEKLPSIRSLAAELKINPRTVVKAYEELSHMGLVVMRQGQGAFITSERPDTPAEARRKVLLEMARRLLAEGARLGADTDEVRDILREASEEIENDE